MKTIELTGENPVVPIGEKCLCRVSGSQLQMCVVMSASNIIANLCSECVYEKPWACILHPNCSPRGRHDNTHIIYKPITSEDDNE